MTGASSGTCPWPGCTTPIPARHLMCRPHWRRLPAGIRARILVHYRRGQTALTATPEYLGALDDALAWAAATARHNDGRQT